MKKFPQQLLMQGNNATQSGSSEKQNMNIPNKLGNYLAQSEAAVLAVWAANMRRRHEQDPIDNEAIAPKAEQKEVQDFLQELEAIAIDSIAANDGNVVYWIGHATKQMNPLLR